MSEKVKSAIDVIKKAMVEDGMEVGSLAHGWHCNIAMACYDSMNLEPWVSLSNEDVANRRRISNDAASRFMKTCFGVEVVGVK